LPYLTFPQSSSVPHPTPLKGWWCGTLHPLLAGPLPDLVTAGTGVVRLCCIQQFFSARRTSDRAVSYETARYGVSSGEATVLA
jgi:hypothetical protein